MLQPTMAQLPGIRWVAAALGALAIAMVAPTGAAAATGATTGSATDVTTTSAVLQGVADAPSDDADYAFQYGPSSNYGGFTQAKPVGSGPTPVSATVSGLQPNTTYHFRLLVSDASTDPPTGAEGQDVTFTTLATAGTVAVTGSATAGHTTLTVHGKVDSPSGGEYAFQYGTSADYGHDTAVRAVGAGVHSVKVRITKLTPGKRYHYRLVVSLPSSAPPYASASVGADRTARTTAPPSVRLRSSRIAVASSGRASVPLACSGAKGGRCHGRVKLAAGATRCGSSGYSAKAGHRSTVRVGLPAACRAKLHATPRLRATATVTTAGHKALRKRVTLTS